MARIRSVHPGFFTDEDLVAVSFGARLLLMGLWVEADDKGVFEWKALTLKMRLFPADNVNVDTLLCELESIDAICRFQHGAKSFGAIRNFRKFQRPKAPNDIHPLPDELRNYVGLGDPISETGKAKGGAFSEMQDGKPSRFPQKGEIAPQMEEGGEDEGGTLPSQEEVSGRGECSTRTREGFRVVEGGAK